MGARRCEGQVAIVTGASMGGTGTAIAVRLAAEGARVAITARTIDGLERTRERIAASGGDCAVFPLDLADPTGGRADLVARVDETLTQLAASGAEMIKVYLPASQPALAVVGAGLGVLRLGYASLLPRFGDLGHALVLQWVRDPHVDDSEWVYADDSLRRLADGIRSQAEQFGKDEGLRRRREARRQQLLAALPGSVTD